MFGFCSYLINGACPFVVMDMAIKSNIYFVSLPKFLQTFPSHGLFKWPFRPIVKVRGISKHTMSSKDQPRLFLSVYCCKAMLNEFVLFRSFPPIMFSVSYTEAKHAIIRGIPGNSESHLFYYSDNKIWKHNTYIIRIIYSIFCVQNSS